MAGTRPHGDPGYPPARRRHPAGVAHSAGAGGGVRGTAAGRTVVSRHAVVGLAATLACRLGGGYQLAAVRADPPAGPGLSVVRRAQSAVAGTDAGVAAAVLGVDLAVRAGARRH